MATFSSKDVGFFQVGGLNILGRITALTKKVSAEIDDPTPLGVAWPAPAAVGISSAVLTQKGVFDDAATSVNAALQARGGTQQMVSLGLGSALGDPAFAFSGAFGAEYEVLAQLKKWTLANAVYTGTGAVYEGIILQPLATKSAAYTGTAHDNASSSANGLGAVLQVGSDLALGGYDSWTVKIEHSSDNISWATKATFTVVTTGPTAFAVTATGTVNRYTRASATLQGSGSSPVLTLTVVMARL